VLPDSSDGQSIDTTNTILLLATPLPGGSSRAQVIEVAPREYFGIIEYKPDATSWRGGITRASAAVPRNFVEGYTGPDEVSRDGQAMTNIGTGVYAFFTPSGVGSASQIQQGKFPVSAVSPGTKRNFGTGLYPISTLALGGGMVQAVVADLTNQASPF